MTQQFFFLFWFIGVDPDLLVFGKYFTSNVRVLPHHYRGNASDPLPSDKRQFIHPPQPAVLPLTSAPTVKPPTTASRALTTTTTTTSATLTSTQQSTSQPSTVPTTTVALSSTPETPLASENHAQTITPTTFTTFLTPSLTTPPSSTTAAAFSTYNPTNTPALSTTTEQPSTSNAYYPTTTFSLPATSPPTPTTALTGNLESSKQNLNDTKVNLGRNHTAGSEGQGISAGDTYGELGPGWHVAAHTLLVAVAICVTVLLSCCCSILLVVSWRGQRKRMGRYRTSWRGKRGSMRLIKYVLVRENTWKSGVLKSELELTFCLQQCFWWRDPGDIWQIEKNKIKIVPLYFCKIAFAYWIILIIEGDIALYRFILSRLGWKCYRRLTHCGSNPIQLNWTGRGILWLRWDYQIHSCHDFGFPCDALTLDRRAELSQCVWPQQFASRKTIWCPFGWPTFWCTSMSSNQCWCQTSRTLACCLHWS